MYKIGKVSYINSLPLFCAGTPSLFDIREAVPVSLNSAVAECALDAALISRWTYTKRVAENYAIVPQFCIGGDGEIFSVKLFSKYPLENLADKKIFITGESGTSIRAFAFICEKKYNFDFFKNRVATSKGADAVFLIGDSALAFEDSRAQYPFLYDLGKMWREFAPVPMIYAVAVVRRSLCAELSAALSDFFAKSLSEFRANPKKYFPRAAELFFKSTARRISDEVLDRYYRALIYKFDEKTFSDTIKFVDEQANI